MDLLGTVNYLLSITGSPEVDSLQADYPEIVAATSRINECQSRLLAEGWWFNTEESVTLYPEIEEGSTTGKIQVTGGIKAKHRSRTYRIQSDTLYDVSAGTDQFSQAVCVDLVVNLPWDSLPYSVRDYIRFKAAYDMIIHDLEDYTKAEFVMRDVQNAMIQLKKEDIQLRPRNALTTPRVLKTRGRVRPQNLATHGFNPNIAGG